MPISFENNKFHLYNDNMSYCIEVTKYNDLMHTYWGKRLENADVDFQFVGRASFSPVECEEDRSYSLDNIPQEYPFYGTTDLRSPAAVIELANGCRVIEPRYKNHKIYAGKPLIDGLPAVYVENDSEADTLEITLVDEQAGVEFILFYTVFSDLNVICRSLKIKNLSNIYLYIDKVLSMNVDFQSDDYKYLHLTGVWAREKQVEICDVHKGTQGFESRRGASGHYENPFMAVMDKTACEDYGNVYGISLVYSGNHSFTVESDSFNMMRVQAGINPFNFKWKLCEGESFSAPEAVLVYSGNGLGDMSHTYHKLYRTRLCRGEYRDKVRPILINNWEATYFNFDEDKLANIAEYGKSIGLELFVLDDGWFGKRNNDTTSLGDWFVDKNKLPGGLAGVAERINKIGLKFGLWFEPEMISKSSELYKKHPEWMFSVPGRKPHPARTQYILNLARTDVCDYIIEAVSDVLKSTNIEYVKWDMNRNMSDIYFPLADPDRQGETMHRYILGLYRVLETLTSRFPHILFEGCSGGGGRNDPGMLYYMPQNWTSDDTDALERIHIQYGASMVYPASSMTAHVSAVPNHQVGRNTPFSMRGTVAMAGMFGYELDLSKMSAEELDEAAKQVEFYKSIRDVITFGDFYRLLDTDSGPYYAWMYLSEDKNTAVISVVTKKAEPNAPRKRIYLKGLNEKDMYEIEGKRYYGSTLMYAGIEYIDTADYANKVFICKRIKFC